MKIIFLLVFLISIFYLMSTSPVNFMMLILMQSILICLISWIYLKSSWFSYILFLIFLGGLMVLFIYITSLASNEKMMINLSSPQKFFLPISILLTMFIYLIDNQSLMKESSNTFKMFNSIFSFNLSLTTLFVMIYLLLVLIIVVKISNKFEGPIKNLI